MTGYDGTRQDWLEGQADDQLERERRERDSHCVDIGGVDGVAKFSPNETWLGITLKQAGQHVAQFSMDYDIAVRFANAILSEVEIAQRGEHVHMLPEEGDNCLICGINPKEHTE